MSNPEENCFERKKAISGKFIPFLGFSMVFKAAGWSTKAMPRNL